jgi:hypothetical protein
MVRQILSTTDLAPIQAQVNAGVGTMMASQAAVYIRGVATELTTRSLVLITNRNEILDVLTPTQQELLHQRIVWEVAHYLRYWKIRHQAEALTPLRLPSPQSPVLPGIRPFYQLMAWMQAGPVAIATNLFQEASLAQSLETVPNPMPMFSALPADLGKSFQQLRNRLTSALVPFKPGTTALVPTSPRQEGSLGSQVAYSVESPPGAALLAEEAAFPLASSFTANPDTANPETSRFVRSRTSEENTGFIETDVILMGYEHSLLERIVRWLDRLLVWLEGWFGDVWKTVSRLGKSKP